MLEQEFKNYAVERLRDSQQQIERCVRLLDDGQVWHRPNEVSNSIGNLVLHLRGNVRQWIVSGLGGEPFERDRPAEFAHREPIPAEEILGSLRKTLDEAAVVIKQLSQADLERQFNMQGYEVSGVAAVFHVVEHFSLHTGQIVYATKLLTGQDLSLYDPQGRRIDKRTSGTP